MADTLEPQSSSPAWSFPTLPWEWEPLKRWGNSQVGSLEIYIRVGNLQILWGMLELVVGAVGGMMATYRSYGADCKGVGAVCWQPGACWNRSGAVCWQATGLMGQVGKGLGCMLATYRSYGACWSGFGLYVGNLQV